MNEHVSLIKRTGDVTLSPIPTMDQASMFKALDEGFTTMNAKAAISTNAVNKYIDFYKNSKVQGICNTVIFILFIYAKKSVKKYSIFLKGYSIVAC